MSGLLFWLVPLAASSLAWSPNITQVVLLVRKIAKDGETGPATIMISGLATGMQSVAVPVLTIAGIIFFANMSAGLYGVGMAAVGMLATVGITMAIDAYGPVADNAGGIAEMAEMGPETREITDLLDEVGNSTAAIGKGFAISVQRWPLWL